jgi:hypothetical protein
VLTSTILAVCNAGAKRPTAVSSRPSPVSPPTKAPHSRRRAVSAHQRLRAQAPSVPFTHRDSRRQTARYSFERSHQHHAGAARSRPCRRAKSPVHHTGMKSMAGHLVPSHPRPSSHAPGTGDELRAASTRVTLAPVADTPCSTSTRAPESPIRRGRRAAAVRICARRHGLSCRARRLESIPASRFHGCVGTPALPPSIRKE